jgi:hypothetical protein
VSDDAKREAVERLERLRPEGLAAFSERAAEGPVMRTEGLRRAALVPMDAIESALGV